MRLTSKCDRSLVLLGLVLFAAIDLEVNSTFGGGNRRLPQCDATVVRWNQCVYVDFKPAAAQRRGCRAQQPHVLKRAAAQADAPQPRFSRQIGRASRRE